VILKNNPNPLKRKPGIAGLSLCNNHFSYVLTRMVIRVIHCEFHMVGSMFSFINSLTFCVLEQARQRPP